MTKPLKVRILGSGGAAAKHRRAFDEIPGLYEVTDGDSDIIDICTANYRHFEQAHEAIHTGHVIVEKPVCGSLLECDALAAAEYATGNLVCPIFQYRFAGHEPIGGWIFTQWNRDDSYYAGWRGDWSTALGGCLISHGIHAIDLMLQTAQPRSVNSRNLTTNSHGLETQSSIDLRLSDETTRRIVTTVAANIPQEGFRLGDAHTGYVNQFRLLHEALTNGTPLPVTLKEARQSLEVLTACYYSAYIGQPVTLPIEPTHPFYNGWSQHMKEANEWHTETEKAALKM